MSILMAFELYYFQSIRNWRHSLLKLPLLFGSSQLYPAKASLPVLATYYHCSGSGLALPCPVCPVLSRLPCPVCPVPFALPCPVCPALSRLSCSDPSVLHCLSFPCLVLDVRSRFFLSRLPILGTVSWNTRIMQGLIINKKERSLLFRVKHRIRIRMKIWVWIHRSWCYLVLNSSDLFLKTLFLHNFFSTLYTYRYQLRTVQLLSCEMFKCSTSQYRWLNYLVIPT
jgi:hypothetical protein